MKRFTDHRTALIILLFTLSFLILIIRNPIPLLYPNFFAEDGIIFYDNIIKHGASSVFIRFNGYYLVGIYLLIYLASGLNFIFGNNFSHLPAFFALVSYGFIAFSIILPITLFRHLLQPKLIILYVLMASFVPLRGWDYAILGVIGNLKFLAPNLALFLILYRLQEFSRPYNFNKFLCDLGIIIAAYTNLTVYLIFPLYYLATLAKFYQARIQTSKYKQNLLPIFCFSCIIAIQIIIVLTSGITKIPGYLDSPFDISKTVEILIARTFLYPLIFPFYKFLSDLFIIPTFITILSFTAIVLWPKQRLLLIFSLITIFASSLLLIQNRPGVHIFFHSYQDSGPSQFFFGQNLILVYIFFTSLQRFFLSSPKHQTIIILILTLFICLSIPKTGSFGRDLSIVQNIGTLKENLDRNCRLSDNTPTDYIRTSIYPTRDIGTWAIPRWIACH